MENFGDGALMDGKANVGAPSPMLLRRVTSPTESFLNSAQPQRGPERLAAISDLTAAGGRSILQA